MIVTNHQSKAKTLQRLRYKAGCKLQTRIQSFISLFPLYFVSEIKVSTLFLFYFYYHLGGEICKYFEMLSK